MTDLSPRHPLPAEPDRAEARQLLGRRRKAIVGSFVALLVIVASLIVLLFLPGSTTFFRNADEAIAERVELGDRRFRLQGRVVPSSVTVDGGVTTFEVIHNCASVSVRHTANPPDLFESPWIPVVLSGQWVEGDVVTVAGRDTHYFLSDDMAVKHTNEYVAANEDRLPDPNEPPEGFLDDCPFEVPRL
ncbi:MAG: cytochrome c maturation protein CcmE [Acidimicrobiaceae bacterium]|nr:cytochrome c maturation protein CcmE [Acidimicrobiaceae bacterium]